MGEFALVTRSKIAGIMKSICSFLIIISLLFPLSLNAFSINIDGLNDGIEWDNAPVNLLLDGESNSRINYAAVKNLINAEENALYLCFMFIDPLLESDNKNFGISLTAEASESFTFDISDSPFHEDTYDYSFDGALAVDENHGATCEVRLGFKKGLPRKISLDVRFIDSSGVYSNVYSISIINSYYSETTELVINETEHNNIKTTKQKTTAYAEEKTTDYTLKKPTTKSEKKKTEFYIQTSPPYSYVRKTKAPKTTASVAKTTKKLKDATAYYEKEIIISQVFVTAEKSTAVAPSVTEMPASVSSDSAISSSSATNSLSLSEGTKYKIIIGVLSAVSFTVIAAASTMNIKKAAKKDDSPDSQ